MNKIRIATIICIVFLLLGGCSGASTSSTPIQEVESENITPALDIKLAHRLMQRGYDVEVLDEAFNNEMEETDSENSSNQTVSALEKMVAAGSWAEVQLMMDDRARTMFHQETLQYFEEDVYENYPPPRQNTIDVIATVIYEQDTGFVLDGVIRNGFSNRSFTREELENLHLRLVTANNHTWIATTLGGIDGFNVLESRVAVPFRLFIPSGGVIFPEFEYAQYSYYAIVEQPKIDESA